MELRERILKRLNEGRESDATRFTWENTPTSLKNFWGNILNKSI